MSPSLFLLGLELARFAGTDDSADALSASLDALQSGGWTLSPYTGPAIQPYLGLRLGQFDVALAPGAAWRNQSVSSEDGRVATLRTQQWRVEARARMRGDRWLAGIDGALSDGSASLDGAVVAEAQRTWEVGPTAGVHLHLVDQLELIGRVRWPVVGTEHGVSHGPAGAVALEWQP